MANEIADGIEYKEEENCFVFRVMKNNIVGTSKSGKMTFNANSHGWAELPNNFKVNMMLGTSKPKAVKPPRKEMRPF